MGGDGGVIASNRRYMRHAGAADHTGDRGKSSKLDPALAQQEVRNSMRFCHVSHQALDFKDTASSESIAVCPYGRLYVKEAAVEALLRRKQESKADDRGLLGSHIRGLKDLHSARFASRQKDGVAVPICPITETELNGNIPAVVLVPGTPDKVNVLSEKGWGQLGGDDQVLAEYGPCQKKIRLAPGAAQLEVIKKELDEERQRKDKKKKKKKRKLQTDSAKEEDHELPSPKKIAAS